ncbi:hypothetical protein [Micromonospora endolithica]|uniref:Uncharacterized protein n=1 Tax=Micromonospora endolithica TaxID=230091 RepID=A0A3A9YYF1_9ACTN|nr:hypothetical protein [Micromonospora endolithica]RKN41101.1 hypothetical protein D7223_25520 [Micromonospora endolithica]TWJ24329.1 hypothetical protein JD76_04478 [Micromonospora endolithica]
MTGVPDCTQDPGRTPVAVTVAAGAVATIGAAVLSTVIFPPADQAGRLLLVAIVVGVFAARVADLRAVGAVTALAMATFVGFLVNRFGDLTGSAEGWALASVIGFAAVLGLGFHRMAVLGETGAGDPDRGPVPPDGTSGGARAA